MRFEGRHCDALQMSLLLEDGDQLIKPVAASPGSREWQASLIIRSETP
jgi:hypothetical protein